MELETLKPPLFVKSAKFKCQKEVDNPAVPDSDVGNSASRLAECVLLLVASALKCVVNASSSNSLSSVFKNYQLVTISLEEIRLVSTNGPWLTINYAPGSSTEWARKVHVEPLVAEIPANHALSLTVKLADDQECFDVMEAVLAAKMRLLRHLKWLEDRLPLLDTIFLSSITSQQRDGSAEIVLAHCPQWGTAVALPPAWNAFVNGFKAEESAPSFGKATLAMLAPAHARAPPGAISLIVQTHLGRSVVRLTAAALEQHMPGQPSDGDLVAFVAEPSPAIQTAVAELAKHNASSYHTGADLQAKVVMKWARLSGSGIAPAGAARLLRPPAEQDAAAAATVARADIDSDARTSPEFTYRHLIIAVSFIIAVLAMVVHHFIKKGMMSSGFLLLDLAAGVSLAGMAIASVPMFVNSARESPPSLPAVESGAERSDGEHVSGAEWALVIVQGDVVERDVDAEVGSDSADDPVDVSLRVEDSAMGAERDTVKQAPPPEPPVAAHATPPPSTPPAQSGHAYMLHHSSDDANVHQDAQQPSVGDSSRPLNARPSLGDSGRRHTMRVRTVQSSAAHNSIPYNSTDLDGGGQPLSPRKSTPSRTPFMPEGPRDELLSLLKEPQWQPPQVHPILVEDMVQRFYVGCKEDLAEAKRRVLVTKKFREENGINNVLNTPQPHFFRFKQVYEHGMIGHTRNGALVTVERVGGVRKAFDTMMAENMPKPELKKHMFFMSEYYDLVADPRPLPDGKLLKILDIAGLGMYDVFGNIFNFLYECMTIGTEHYPERLLGMYVINAPHWINMLWKAFTPAIDPATRERIQLCGTSKKKILEMLSAELDMDVIPEQYGGRNTLPISETKLEKDLYAFVSKLNGKSGAPTS